MHRSSARPPYSKAKVNPKESALQQLRFEKKCRELENMVLSDHEDSAQINAESPEAEENKDWMVFLSASNSLTRAVVFKGSGPSLKLAWDKAVNNTLKFIKHNAKYNPIWIKADIITEVKEVSYRELCREIGETRDYFYRKGISFDFEFKTALLESELNTRLIYDYKESEISLVYLNEYLTEKGIAEMREIPDQLFTFMCKGYFFDGNCYRLYDSGYDYGRRVEDLIDKPLIKDILMKSGEFLAKQMNQKGEFIYGFYPSFDMKIGGYNILRHASSLWGLVLCYQIIGGEEIKEKIQQGVNYLLGNIVYYSDDAAFLVDKTLNEIKLGGNGLAIIMLTEYMETFHTDVFRKTIEALGNGILMLQNKETGEYFHVLKANDFSLKARERTVYYDGEAVFALMRLYRHFDDEKWLDAAKLSFGYFIKNNYYKYADHWLSYAVNEYLKNKWDDGIFKLGIDNLTQNLDRIYRRDTTYHTFLELLMSAFEMVTYAQNNKPEAVDKVEDLNMKEFVKVIFHRAKHQLNGFTYPEMAMYFKSPIKSVNTFCVRHDAFRIRIDDVQHNIDGYYYLYRYYNELIKYTI